MATKWLEALSQIANFNVLKHIIYIMFSLSCIGTQNLVILLQYISNEQTRQCLFSWMFIN